MQVEIELENVSENAEIMGYVVKPTPGKLAHRGGVPQPDKVRD